MKIILDMDGVITSEEGYFRSAFCALKDFAARLGHAPSQRWIDAADPWALYLDKTIIGAAKQRLINTNWDLCHIAALALILRLCKHDPTNADLLAQAEWDSQSSISLRWPDIEHIDANILIAEALALAPDHNGFSLIEQLAALIASVAPTTCPPALYARQGLVWYWLYFHFQVWFNGTEAAAEAGISVEPFPHRDGIAQNEPLILDPAHIRTTLSTLRAAGHTLGIATGRTSAELLPTLRRHDLLRFFDPTAIVTDDEVVSGERTLIANGLNKPLSKPHPFPFLRALFPDTPVTDLIKAPFPQVDPKAVIIVGDTLGDIRGGVAIGATTVAVLTGPAGAAAEASLREAGASLVIADLTHLPTVL